MSLNDRFTQLRRRNALPEQQEQGIIGGRVDGRGGTAKNKKLALQMSRRPTVVAALAREALGEIKSSALNSAYGSEGKITSPRRGFRRSYSRGRARGFRGSRSNGLIRSSDAWGSTSNLSTSGFFRRGRSRGRERNRGFGRSASIGRMQRSASLASLRSNASFRSNSSFRSKPGRGRGRGGIREGRSSSVSRMYRNASVSSFTNLFRGRGRGRGRGTTVAKGFINRREVNRRGHERGNFNRGRGGFGIRGSPHSGFRGRGAANRGFRGVGRGGSAQSSGRWQKQPPPDKDALDKELDLYMSGSRAHLDKELDHYMNQSDEKWN